jgi:hypothetical protein
MTNIQTIHPELEKRLLDLLDECISLLATTARWPEAMRRNAVAGADDDASRPQLCMSERVHMEQELTIE